jgi:uncharacterized protein (DUF1800 family)
MRCHVVCLFALAHLSSGLNAYAADPVISHVVPVTTAEVGRTRVIAFNVNPPAEADQSIAATVSDPAVLEIVRAPRILAGESLGYLRVRAMRPGQAIVAIAGASVTVNVFDAGSPSSPQALRIIGPSDGATVWDQTVLGVELRCRRSAAPSELRIEVSGEASLQSRSTSRPGDGQHILALFDWALEGVAPGTYTLEAVATFPKRELRSASVSVTVAQPAPGDLLVFEAETPFEGIRPERFADDRQSIGRDDDASGGRFFVNASASPAACIGVDVPESSNYQIMVRAGGTAAQGVMPTIGVVVDDGQISATNGRLLDSSWHRLSIGVPIHLDAGTRVLTPYFANDFYAAGLADRNLYLDRVELLKVSGENETAVAQAMPDHVEMSAMSMSMTMASGAGAARNTDDPLGQAAVPLRVSFMRVYDGATLPGVFDIEGRCWAAGVPQAEAPVVTLMVNDRPVLKQRSFAPKFLVDPSNFSPGTNILQMKAVMDNGVTALTPVQVVQWPAEAAEARLEPRCHHRFSIHEERWAPDILERLSAAHNPKERRAAAFPSNGTATLNLPDDVVGPHRVMVEMRGQHFDGAPVVDVVVHGRDGAIEVGQIDASTWWNERHVGVVDIPEGSKTLTVSFVNDKFEEGQGDRNVWLEAVVLIQEPTERDIVAPTVEVLYPPPGHAAWMTDVLVAESSDNASLNDAELLIDGRPSGLTVSLNLKPGLIVLPLLLRELAPGSHQFAVRVSDVTGNTTQSVSRTIEVLSEPPAVPSAYARAVRLLDRLAYGPDARELAAVLVQGEKAWLRSRLYAPFDLPGDRAAATAYLPYFVNRNNYEVPRRVLSHATLTPNPVRARFVLWAQNHFSTWIRKTGAIRKWDEHVAFARLGVSTFEQLLRTSAESPAMLAYLDQERSFAGRLNENYSREILELHTLGVDGGYSQEDVTALAGVLTGWTSAISGDGRGGGEEAREYMSRFDARLSDGQATRLLGLELDTAESGERLQRIDVIMELLVAHPSTARFVAESLVEHYVAVPAPSEMVDSLARTYLEHSGDMAVLMSAMIEHPQFWAAAPRAVSPLDYAVRLSRTTGLVNPWQIGDFLQRCGFGLFDRATPDGYPEADAAFSSSNTMLQRWRLARDNQWSLVSLVPGRWRWSAELPENTWAQRIVDVVAVRLTGHPLTSSSNQATLDLIARSNGSRDERARLAATFIAHLPEVSLR